MDERREISSKARRSKAVTREVILAAAIELFTDKGYERTTVAEVAEEAGVAVGTIYRHFPDKAEILYAAKGKWEGEFSDVFSHPEVKSEPHRQRIRPLVEALFKEGARHSRMLQLMALPQHVLGEANNRAVETPKLRAIREFLDEAVATGQFRAIDTEAASVISYGMVESALRQCFEVEGGENRQRYIEALVDALEHWVFPEENSSPQ